MRASLALRLCPAAVAADVARLVFINSSSSLLPLLLRRAAPRSGARRTPALGSGRRAPSSDPSALRQCRLVSLRCPPAGHFVRPSQTLRASERPKGRL